MNTAVLILNWNGASDTIECLSALLPTLTDNDYLFLIDNGSADRSVSEITEYLQSQRASFIGCDTAELPQFFSTQTKLYFCYNKTNNGFGGGNNRVLRQLKSLGNEFEFAWLLNNDALPDPAALYELKKAMTEPTVGVAGSLILNYPARDTVQCSGVKHYKWLGVSKLINKNIPLNTLSETPVKYDYLNGASIMFRIAALEKTGFFDEAFFLYSEELDLQLRLAKKGYTSKLALKSKVYHKLSGGTSKNKHLFYFHYNASAVRLNRKHYGPLPTFVSLFGLGLITLVRSFPNFKNTWWGVKGICRGLLK